jgi:hypothetical protein
MNERGVRRFGFREMMPEYSPVAARVKDSEGLPFGIETRIRENMGSPILDGAFRSAEAVRFGCRAVAKGGGFLYFWVFLWFPGIIVTEHYGPFDGIFLFCRSPVFRHSCFVRLDSVLVWLAVGVSEVLKGTKLRHALYQSPEERTRKDRQRQLFFRRE